MDNLIIADPASVFNLFGEGFLVGCVFTLVVTFGFLLINRRAINNN